MSIRLAFAVWAAFALAVGCSTVKNARDVQKATAPKGDDAASATAVGKLDLRGATLERLVAFAVSNRPSIVSRRLAVEDARLALKALAADAPLVSDTPWTAASLGASGGYAESSAGATIGRSDGWQTHGSPSAALSLDLLVWDFGRYDARAKAQAEAVLAAEQALVDEGYAVFGQVARSYFDVMEARALLEVARTNERQYGDHLALAKERQKAGEAYKLDILKARLDLAKAHQATVAASNQVATAGAELMFALGVEASRGTCDEVFGTDSPGIGCVYRGFSRSTDTIDEAFAFARTNAPAVRVARAELRAASHDVDAAIADLYPSIRASASLNWTDPLWAWNWGVNAVQSLFQGFSKVTAVDRSVVALRQAATGVDAAEQQLSVSLETALAVRDNSEEAVRSAWASVRSAKENLDTVREQLSLGDVSRIELSDAIAADSKARGDCITAYYDGQRAEAALFVTVGRYPVYNEGIIKGEVK